MARRPSKRSQSELRGLAVAAGLVKPGKPGQPITLPAITVTLAVPSLDYQAAQGTLVASLPPVPAGATRTIAGDSRLALNGGKTSVVVGSGALSPGATLTAIITDTLAGATNSPVSAVVNVPVTATLPAITASTANPTVAADAPAGTVVLTLSAVPAGATRTWSGDGQLVLNSAKTALVVASITAASGGTITGSVTDTLAGATNSPVSKALSVAVTSVLPAITASPASPTVAADAPAGTQVVTLSAVPAGATRAWSGDGQLVLNSAKTALVVSAITAASGGTITGTVTDTRAGATNSPVSKALSVAVTSVLPAIAVSPASPSFAAGAAAGSVIATLSAVPAGASRSISGDGRVVLNSTKDALVVGLTASSAGSAVSVTVTDTRAGATNSPLSQAISISVTAAAARVLATNVAEASMPARQPSSNGGNELTIVRQVRLVSAMTDLELVYRNGTVNADGTTTGAPALTGFGASLRPAGSSSAPAVASFGGSTEIALASGAVARAVFTGPFAAGLYELRTYLKKTDAAAFQGSNATASWHSGGGFVAGKHLADASVDLGDTNASPYPPLAILGTPSGTAPKTFLLYGDSIAAGLEDNNGSANSDGDRGGFSKGITAAGAAHTRFTVPSMSMRTAASSACRASLLEALTLSHPDWILDEMGVNDFLQDGASLADWQARKVAIWDWFVANGYSGRVIATTITPTNGTADAARQSANSWMLGKPHPALRDVWDVALAVTGSSTGTAYTIGLSGDGVHPNSDGHNTVATFIQGKVAALGSSGSTVTPWTWNAGSASPYVTVADALATFKNTGSGTATFDRVTATPKLKATGKVVMGLDLTMPLTFGGTDFSLLLAIGTPAGLTQNFSSDIPDTLSVSFTDQKASINNSGTATQPVHWDGHDPAIDMTAAMLAFDFDALKWTLRFANTGWGLDANLDITSADRTAWYSLPTAFTSGSDLSVFARTAFFQAEETCSAKLLSTADQLASRFPSVSYAGFTPIAGAGSTSTDPSTADPNDTSGGTSYVTPSGAGDGADGSYTFGETVVADPVASRGRLRVATTPLSAGSGDQLTFWAHDYFSTQGVNVNLMEEVNRDRINFVTGFLKHLRPALIRVALTSTDTNIINMYKALCDAVGCKMVFQGMSFNDYSESTMAQKAAACVARVKALGGAQYIAWLEGMNEADLNLWRFGASDNATAISMMVDMHTRCYDALKADAATSGILIAAPSCTGTNGQVSTDVNTAIKGMSSKYDAGNARWYSGKWEPNMPTGGVDGNGYGTVEYELAKARATANGKVPVVITECGYHNAIQNVTLEYPHLPVREDTASLYMPDVFTRPYSQGARVVTNYQVTDFSSGTQTDKANDQENFGYLRYGARTVKPAGITMARFNAKLRDDATAPAMVAIPAYTLTGVSNLVRYNFQKSNGQYIIVLKDGRRAVDVDTEKWSGSTRTAPFNPNALLIYPGSTGNIKFTSKDWSKVEWYNVHLDTTVLLTKKDDGSYDLPMSQKTGMLILTP